MGVFIVQGTEMPPQLLASVPDLQGSSDSDLSSSSPSGGGRYFQLLKAETKDPLVRQFVGGLVTGISPVPDFAVLSSREVQQRNAAS
jgi:hypothetical protein